MAHNLQSMRSSLQPTSQPARRIVDGGWGRRVWTPFEFSRLKARREGGQTPDKGCESRLTHRPKRARGTTRYDGRGPPSAELRPSSAVALLRREERTGPLAASCDRTGQTRNCERGQTGVEQRIAALPFLARATLYPGGAGAGFGGGFCSAGPALRSTARHLVVSGTGILAA
jgi:hypothetical protein